MTKKELVELLNKNYKDDEEVFVSYMDEYDRWIDSIEKIDNVTINYSKGHEEVLVNGEWKPFNKKEHPDYHNYPCGSIKWVHEKDIIETKMCIIADQCKEPKTRK